MRYYLHLRDGQDIAIDQEGLEFRTISSLQDAMRKAARDIIAGDVKRGVLDLNLRIDAETQSGQLVCSLPFSSALSIAPMQVAA